MKDLNSLICNEVLKYSVCIYIYIYIFFFNHINVLKVCHSKDVFVSMYSRDINGKI